jgi:hypothetical protein
MGISDSPLVSVDVHVDSQGVMIAAKAGAGFGDGVTRVPDHCGRPRHRSIGLGQRRSRQGHGSVRMAFGFASPDALMALAMLNLGGHRPAPQADDPRISQGRRFSFAPGPRCAITMDSQLLRG